MCVCMCVYSCVCACVGLFLYVRCVCSYAVARVISFTASITRPLNVPNATLTACQWLYLCVSQSIELINKKKGLQSGQEEPEHRNTFCDSTIETEHNNAVNNGHNNDINIALVNKLLNQLQQSNDTHICSYC